MSRLFCVYVVLWVGSGLATDWSPVQGVLPIVCRIKKVKKRPDGWMDGWMGGWVDGWVDGWMGGWTDGRMDRQVEVQGQNHHCWCPCTTKQILHFQCEWCLKTRSLSWQLNRREKHFAFFSIMLRDNTISLDDPFPYLVSVKFVVIVTSLF
jgi:hypothetical protein